MLLTHLILYLGTDDDDDDDDGEWIAALTMSGVIKQPN